MDTLRYTVGLHAPALPDLVAVAAEAAPLTALEAAAAADPAPAVDAAAAACGMAVAASAQGWRHFQPPK